MPARPPSSPIRPASSVAAALCAFAVAVTIAAPSPARACERVATVSDVRADDGAVMIVVYASEADFRRTAAAQWSLPPTATTLRVPLCGVRGEWLAVLAFQDRDGDGRLGSNLLGFPNEPWGASGPGNPMGAPTWATTRVRADAADVPVALKR